MRVQVVSWTPRHQFPSLIYSHHPRVLPQSLGSFSWLFLKTDPLQNQNNSPKLSKWYNASEPQTPGPAGLMLNSCSLSKLNIYSQRKKLSPCNFSCPSKNDLGIDSPEVISLELGTNTPFILPHLFFYNYMAKWLILLNVAANYSMPTYMYILVHTLLNI